MLSFFCKKKLFTFEKCISFTFGRKKYLHLEEKNIYTWKKKIFTFEKCISFTFGRSHEKGALAPKLLGRILGRCSRLFRIPQSLAPLALRNLHL